MKKVFDFHTGGDDAGKNSAKAEYRRRHRLDLRKKAALYRKKNRERIRKKRQSGIRNLSDGYVRELLMREFPGHKLDQKLVELKRKHLVELRRRRKLIKEIRSSAFGFKSIQWGKRQVAQGDPDKTSRAEFNSAPQSKPDIE